MELESLIQIFGSAGVTFYIMWLWLSSVREEKKDLEEKLSDSETKRIIELKEMLPLLSDASKSLQTIIKTNSENNEELVNGIKTYIDNKFTEISEKWKEK